MCACALTTVVSAQAVHGMCVRLAAYQCVFRHTNPPISLGRCNRGMHVKVRASGQTCIMYMKISIMSLAVSFGLERLLCYRHKSSLFVPPTVLECVHLGRSRAVSALSYKRGRPCLITLFLVSPTPPPEKTSSLRTRRLIIVFLF